MTIKKSYVELVSFLEANKNKKVSTILDEVYEMTKQASRSRTFLTNKEGDVIAIFCYYHKQWELIDQTSYGKKASSTTGYNTMCKIGVSEWTKQNKAIKQTGETVLSMLENGEIEANEISSTKEKLIDDIKQINEDNRPVCYETEETVLEAYENRN